ncbi:class I SAM-dependent methyltransferase [Flavihumibacter sp. CACIAM 22H1]|uniref:class I SAM-dependent methyltransferase n=1 Tax=Flavihumibacter sp. CACIAM 22H1 TaxID=1812911 RepID=UPI0007A84D1B|nr:class I SAM-dependent methyltransferase [Flavihumibacter sp. CACIAM 22H1]KYP15337.1 MAG: hypothetical protein A1D16_15670 [Flavihumibacter sp. CACIAM 22H1]
MNDSIARFYNRISIIYPLINLFLLRQRVHLLEEVNSYPTGKLLEIGVGDGNHLRLYKKHQIIGIDVSELMLKRARKSNPEKAELYCMNGEALAFADASFDYIVLSHVLAVTIDPDKLLQEIGRVLKPGGTLFLLNHFTPETWLSWMDKAFQPVAKLLRFRSYFLPAQLGTLAAAFTLEKIRGFGLHDYFQLRIYSKP